MEQYVDELIPPLDIWLKNPPTEFRVIQLRRYEADYAKRRDKKILAKLRQQKLPK